MGDKKVDIDENSKDELYNARSRDAAALGFDTIKRVGETSVLVVGLQGVGVEAAKNLILNGPKRVALFDPEVVTIADLGTNFYLKKEHVGTTTRAKASQTELQGLNSNCAVEVIEGKLSDDDIKHFDFVVVGSLLPQEELIRINEVCRNRKPVRAAFVWAVTHGGVATLFSDFGPAHEISDPNGEPVREFVVQNVTSTGVVTVTAKRHGLDDGSLVKFAELEGSISKLNGIELKIREYKICGLIKGKDGVEKRSEKPNERVPNKFVIDLTDAKDAKDQKIESWGEWTNGGVLQEVKPKKIVKYLSLKEAFQKPAEGPVAHMDAGLFFDGRGDQILLATLALLRFQKEKGALPALHSKADTKLVLGYAKAINEEHKKLNAEKEGSALEVKEVNEEIIAKVSKYARTELSGYAAFLGGVAAQELVKLWGKYTPVSQWLTSDHFEMIQAEPPIDAIPQNSRYDHQISIFGKAFQQRLSNQKWFLVGVGALGCEYLKAYAVMGLGTGPKGSIHITDNDNIELSNLSRQFLFRRQHLGKPKSVCAAEVVTGMNPELKDKITVHNQKVEPASEKFFNDAFWDSLDGVWNALDNVQARQYTDSKCLLHSLPLLESGTQGTAGSTDVILPFKTASYQDGAVAETGAIPACTLKNFPNEIAHCIEWARPQFFELFDNEPTDFNAFVQTPDKFFAQVNKSGHIKEKLERLKKVKRLLEVTKERKYSTAIKLALERFDFEFRHRIKDLISFFPEDSRITDKQTGADLGAFWQGAKRFPRAAEFADSDELTFGYVYHTAQIFAYMLGVEPVADEAKFREELKALNYKAPEWKAPTSDKPQELEEGDAAKVEDESEDDFKIAEDLITELKAIDLKTIPPLKPSEFEKDDDKNHHVDFLTHCSNLRAWNYRIQPATRAKVKVTAGRIIPALATTTAATTGLMTLEFYKLLLGFQFWSQSKFKNAQIDFANSAFNYWEPGAMRLIQETKEVDEESKAVTITKAYPSTFSSWDKVVVRKGNLTIKEFVELFPSVHYGVRVDTLHLFGLTAKDIKEKKGKILYGHPKRSTAQYKSQLARKGVSDGNKKKFEEMLKQAEEFNAKIDEQYGSKLIDVFIHEYGPLVSPDRNYVLLSGRFLPPAGETLAEDATTYAKTPVIQYFFK